MSNQNQTPQGGPALHHQQPHQQWIEQVGGSGGAGAGGTSGATSRMASSAAAEAGPSHSSGQPRRASASQSQTQSQSQSQSQQFGGGGGVGGTGRPQPPHGAQHTSSRGVSNPIASSSSTSSHGPGPGVGSGSSTPTSTPHARRTANVSSSSTTTANPSSTNPNPIPSHNPAQVPTDNPWTHDTALTAIRSFLNAQSSYDVFPVSFRLIVLDSMLVVKKALSAMMQHGVVSAPLWNSSTSCFAGMFTVSDVIHLIQYYYHTTSYEGAAGDVDTFRLESIREIEKILHVPPPPLLSVHPMRPLFDACRLLIQTHARRLPLIDHDDQTGKEVVLSVLTQYRVLKFMAVNCRETIHLSKSLRSLGIGTYISDPESSITSSGVGGDSEAGAYHHNPYHPIATATMQTTVFDVVHMFSELGISAVPILDAKGRVINLYETVDVITLVRLGAYHNLDLTMSQALARRASDFSGVVTCTPDDSLASVFTLIRMRRIHRLVVVDSGKAQPGDSPEQAQERAERKGRLLGIISLSDVLRHVIGDVEIGGGGVGAIPVEHVLEAQERRRQGLSSRRGSEEDAVVGAVDKSRTPEMSGAMELGPSV